MAQIGGLMASDELVVIEDGRIDVAAVMVRLRERIREKRDLGRYTDDEVLELTALKLQAFADEAEVDPELLARLMAADHNWNISVDYRLKSHRSGFEGRVIVVLKRLVRPLVRLYTDHVLSRQAQINQYLLHLTHHAVRELVKVQLENAALRRRLDALDAGREGQGRDSKGR
jgi:hypothetical protein